ncbi:MAG: DUF3035 domain-containing protein [Alphaproteobacteria bacterium]|nr:DUF3035 domain-containing protein [Alphaproteobacteria bacterium]
MLPVTRSVLLGVALMALAGCGGTADALGLGRNAPDEFAVVDRPPLSMPPNFDLRPPRPGVARPQEVKMTDRANQTIFAASSGKNSAFTSAASSSDASDSEKALLSEAGSAKADQGIRETIDREASQKVSGSRHLVDEVLWWHSSASAATVDAKAEADRIREAKEKGESINAGATPVIERDKSSWLGL